MSKSALPYKISVLVFLQDHQGDHLLLKRAKSPNRNLWSPIGGKLDMEAGESPCECAIRETAEETGIRVNENDLHQFGMIAERDYEGTGHWLMFLYRCRKPITSLPEPIAEGAFGIFPREEIDQLDLPETDRQALWPLHDRFRDGFVALRAECAPGKPLEITIEESWGETPPGPGGG